MALCSAVYYDTMQYSVVQCDELWYNRDSGELQRKSMVSRIEKIRIE